jgi:hypothetical protein
MRRLTLLLLVLISFTAFSVWVTLREGYFGFLVLAGREPWALQVLLDLCIALFVAWGGLIRDARRQGIAAWPYLLATLALGSIGPLAYLVRREWRAMKATGR